MSRMPLSRFAPGLMAAALAAPAYAAVDAATEIEELKRRLNALEAQQKIAPATTPAKAAAQAAAAPAPGEIKFGESKLTWGGYVKLDTIYSRYSEGEVAQGTARDFYLPGSIPVSAGSGESRDMLDFHAKETRLFVKTETPFDGHKVGTHIEFDFISGQIGQATAGSGNENVTNAYNPALRRAFITFDNWLLGQEWTTFQNLVALPETLDFVAFPTDGTVFGRQPQIRYTLGGLMLAVENTETTVLPFSGGAGFRSDDARVPDFVARYNFKVGEVADLSLAAVVRQLAIEDPSVVGPPAVAARKDTATGAGLSFAGKITLGKDDLKFMLNGGKGIGRYLAAGASTDAVIDADNELEAIRVLAGYLAYKHQWTPQWRSTFTVAHFSADNDIDLTGQAVTKSTQSASANLLYSPVAKLTFGMEFRHATREVESGDDGDLDRVQFSAKYSF
ncbi:MAG: DcaP family trimeric outer membrane transporter [Panacagrimonas sp.]